MKLIAEGGRRKDGTNHEAGAAALAVPASPVQSLAARRLQDDGQMAAKRLNLRFSPLRMEGG